jgi:hypothetical protein
VQLLALLVIALVAFHSPQEKASEESIAKAHVGDACRPALSSGFCRTYDDSCPDPPPRLIGTFKPNVAHVRRPLPSGGVILELGVNLAGEVVSACVVRSLRSDFDSAAQRAAIQSRWTVPKARIGKERGFLLYVSVCTPDKKCTSAARRSPTG